MASILPAPHLSASSLTLVLALHAAALLGLQHWSGKPPLPQLPVLSVSLIVPPAIEPPAAAPKPPRTPPPPKPVVPRPTPPPTAVPTPSAPTTPVALEEAPPAVPPAPTFATPAIPSPSAATPTAPSPPRFEADYLLNPQPPYPSLARRMREEGRVVLRVKVAADGHAEDVQLHASSGSARLDQAALETVRRWKFMPARLGNEAIAASVLVPILFSLKD
jgi:protein TonB